MAAEPLLLIAAGGLARETLATIKAAGLARPIGVLDDNTALLGSSVGGVEVLGGLNAVEAHPDVRLVICAGSGKQRSAIVQRLAEFGIEQERYATVIHPSASVPADCEVGVGAILFAGVALTAGVLVGPYVVAMPNVTLTHDDLVAEFATLCAGVSLGGGVQVGRCAYLGMNASVRQSVVVGENSVLGMGSVLLRNLPDNQVWAGVPARPIGVPTDGSAPSESGRREKAIRV